MAERDDNFLARWSRRKVQGRQAQPPAADANAGLATLPLQAEVSKPSPTPDPSELRADPAIPQDDPSIPQDARGAQGAPLPTLADVAGLTRESDFSRFVAPGVDAGVKNAAMKKLFADPHFNVMDGLDIYIDDYNKFEPIPKSMLRQMVQARALGLLDDELEEQPAADNLPASDDENADLQLQPDDAAGRSGADEGADAAHVAADGVDVADEPGPIEPDAAADADPHDAVPPRSA